MSAFRGITAASFVLAGLAQAAPAQDTIRRLDYPALARTFLQEHGLAEWAASGPAGHEFEAFLDSPVFVRVTLGTLELRIPAKSLEVPEVVEDVQAAAGAAVDVQANWFGWSRG